MKIVGVGASAGGLEAFTKFLQAVPRGSGIAYVLVQHLDPKHKSGLVELLSRATKLPVTEIESGCKVQPDHVYVIPGNTELTIKDAKLYLHPRVTAKQPNVLIDRFLTSLAEDQKADAVGVILSGAASDGTIGLQAIKVAGGITFAQDGSAEYISMPESAIRAGAADFVMPPAGIAKALVTVSQQRRNQSQKTKLLPESAAETSDFNKILLLLESQTGVSMLDYKVATLQRRIQRRLAILNLHSLSEYATFITDNPDEATALFKDLLINVTSFFRDQPALEFLDSKLLPELVSKSTGNQQLRIWVAGCATGEEAYSIAIICREFLKRSSRNVSIKIFATDLDVSAIAQARSGLYSAGALAGLSEEFRERYFTASGANYRVKSSVRDMCIFATHNLLVDPPFPSIDIISCCNVMIYLKPTAQQKLLGSFHFSLKPGGYLMLGTSESIGASRTLFSPLDKKFKIYSRKSVPSPRHLDSPSSIPQKSSVILPSRVSESRPEKADATSVADNVLLSQFTPASVVVDNSMDIIQFHGSTGPYLEAAQGKASLNIFKMARPGLALHLRRAIRHVKENNEPYERTAHIKMDVETQLVTLNVIPIASGEVEDPLLLIVFKDNASDNNNSPAIASKTRDLTVTAKAGADNHLMLQLERELIEQQDELRRLSEEHDIANEELQLANEEVRSSNEELQSLNEELETSSEELASTNEELVSMNQTLRAGNEALTAARDYAESIIATVREPLIVLDSDMKVLTANDSFYRFFKVTKQATEGSHIFDLGNGQWRIPKLRAILEGILSKNIQFQDYLVEHDFPIIGPKSILLDARRIHTENTSDQLVLLAIEDISERKQAQEALQNTADRLRFMAESMPQKVFTATPDGSRDYFNPQWSEFTGAPIEQILGWGWAQFIHPDDLDETLTRWKISIASGKPFEHKDRYRRADGTYHWHLSRACALTDEDGNIVTWVGSNTDIEDIMRTKKRSAELELTTSALKRQRNQLVELNRAKEEFINLASHQLRTPATGVKQYVDMLLDGYAGEMTQTQREFLKEASESNERQLHIIDDLLKIANVDSGRLTLDKIPTNLVTLIDSILKEQAASFALHKQRAVFKHTASSVIATIDGQKIRMVLENLIENASKYSHEGKLITVALSQKAADVLIAITDKGVGIDTSNMKHLFQKFSRLDNDMSVSVSGNGLGLYWAKKIVDLHGGSIAVASTNGKGSTFTVTLPTDSHSQRNT